MGNEASAMMYAVLRGVRNEAKGFVRAEERGQECQLTVRAEGLPAAPLRLLLVSDGEDGAALDLGVVDGAADGTLSLCRSLPPAELRPWDALVLAEDWPSGALVAAAWLHGSTGPVWQIAETAKWYLKVPSGQPVS